MSWFFIHDSASVVPEITMKHIISLGAGVQSSCMALMAKHGEITPMPDAAIFADVGAEPKSVYDYLEYLKEQLPFPVYTVMEKDGLLADIEKGISGKRCSNPPFYTREKGTKGILTRTCTVDFKIRPLTRKTKELAGIKGRLPKEPVVTTWIGISLDEIQRMKESHTKWIKHRWPLIDLRMKRYECTNWMKKMGYKEPPRSACWFCPYHSNHEWRRLKEQEPEEFAKALELDERIRDGVYNVRSQLFVHKEGIPLKDVDLRTDEDKGQGTFFSRWNEECDGMCGM